MAIASATRSGDAGADLRAIEVDVALVEIDVVGESNYQDAHAGIAGPPDELGKRFPVGVVLRCEPTNEHDSNAVRVECVGQLLGYIPRASAARLGPAMTQHCGSALEASAFIVGGWNDGFSAGSYGVRVWVKRTDLDRIGVAPASVERQSPTPRPRVAGTPGLRQLDTGFAEAWASDNADDTYDLSWSSKLPEADRPAIAMLRELLANPSDPIDRHFQFAELERRLYRARDLYQTALADYDAICIAHDAEIETMRHAFITKWGRLPRLELYRQAAIRKAKQRDWDGVLFWSERGLTIYGDDAARESAVEDLLKRRNQARAKLGMVVTSSDARGTRDESHSAEPELGDDGGATGAALVRGVQAASADSRKGEMAADVTTNHDTTDVAPAGWYEDPMGRFHHRYWDGTRWTDHVSRDGVASRDPL